MKLRYTALLLLPALGLLSCLRDDIPHCRSLTVEFGIEDLNFQNQDVAEGVRPNDPSTPFNKIVSRLNLHLQNYSTGATIDRRTIVPEGDNPTFEVAFNDSLPYGDYIVTVWANARESSLVTSPDGSSLYQFARYSGSGDNDEDLFLCRDTVSYTPGGESPKVMLRRAKGLLLIETSKLPTSINSSRISATNLRAEVNENLQYSGAMGWDSTLPLAPSGTITYTSALLPPSTATDATRLVTRYYDGEILRQITPEVNLTIERNKITRLKYEWDDNQSVTVYLLVDGEWERITSLDITEQ